MSERWRAILLLFALCLGTQAWAEVDFPIDPDICVSPIEWGDPGAPPYASIRSRDWPQFFPGHSTPFFLNSAIASINRETTYLDEAGKLRTHATPPKITYADKFYLGADGEIYLPKLALARDKPVFVLERSTGEFRAIRPDESGKLQQAQRILANIKAAASPAKAEGWLNWGTTRPVRAKSDGRAISDRDFVNERRWATTPHFGLEVETEGETLRLVWGDRRRVLDIPGVGHSMWDLTELQQSERVLFRSWRGGPYFLIDPDLDLTVPDGGWRLESIRETVYLPMSGEAILRSLWTWGADGLFWLRDRRISGAGICGDTKAPPVQTFRLVSPEGAEKINTIHISDAVSPVWTGQSFMTAGNNGVFDALPGRPVEVRTDLPKRRAEVWQVPDSGLILIGYCDRFFLHDGTEVVFASGRIRSLFDDRCVEGLQPVSRDASSGVIWLARGWRVSIERGLDRSDSGAAESSWSDWLNRRPDREEWPRSRFTSLGEPVHTYPGRVWWKLPRFDLAIRKDEREWQVRTRDGATPAVSALPPRGHEGRNSSIRHVFDPGEGDAVAVANSPDELFLIAPEGSTRPLVCAPHCTLGNVHLLHGDATRPDAVLVGAEAGLFRYLPDLGLAPLVPVSMTGPIYGMQSIAETEELIIDAAFGVFIWSERLGLRILDPENSTQPWQFRRVISPEGAGGIYSDTRVPMRIEFLPVRSSSSPNFP